MNILKFFYDGIRAQVRNARGWIYLGWMDFTVPYRKTFIGPIWEILSAVIWVTGLSIVFYTPDFADISSYVAYVAAGIVIFGYISHILNSTPPLYHSAANTMRTVKISPAFFILRNLVLNLIRFACQLIVAFVAVAYFASLTDMVWLDLFLGTFVVLFTSIWVSLLFAAVGARFPDIVQVVTAITRALLFVTPVFWTVGDSSLRNIIATYNPLTYFLEVMRAPMLGDAVSMRAWAVVIITNLVLIPVALLTYRFTRHRILNWV